MKSIGFTLAVLCLAQQLNAQNVQSTGPAYKSGITTSMAMLSGNYGSYLKKRYSNDSEMVLL